MLLLDHVRRLDRLRVGRTALCIHFSGLSSVYRKEGYLRIAFDAFSAVASGFEGQLFRLKNGDLFFIVRGATQTILEAAVERIRMLFSQDPFLEAVSSRGDSAFCSWYNLEKDYDQFLADVSLAAERAESERLKEEAQEGKVALPSLVPVRPEILDRLEKALQRVDVSNIARRQSVCTLIDNGPPQPLFEEIFVSIDDLQNAVTPGIDLGSNPWLFRYLTQTLDRRVMLLLIRDGLPTSRPLSININVATVLAPEFSRFESIVPPTLRGRLVIEMNALDIFSDMGAFLFARDYLHDHGFRLCLDGLTHHTLPFYSRARLGFDLVKLYWTPNALDGILPSMVADVRKEVMDTGQAHTILCRCDDERAIRTGQDLGIVMFQGRIIDRLLMPVPRGISG